MDCNNTLDLVDFFSKFRISTAAKDPGLNIEYTRAARHVMLSFFFPFFLCHRHSDFVTIPDSSRRNPSLKLHMSYTLTLAVRGVSDVG